MTPTPSGLQKYSTPSALSVHVSKGHAPPSFWGGRVKREAREVD